MKKIVLSALAVAAAAGVANAQSVEYRIIERFSDAAISNADAGPTGTPGSAGNVNDSTLWFVVQARVTGLTPGTFSGLGGFAGSIDITSGGGGGNYKSNAGINNSPTTFTGPGLMSVYPQGLGTQALFAPFRLVADNGSGANGTISGNSLVDIAGAAGGTPLDVLQAEIDEPGSSGAPIDTNAAWGVDNWVPVFTFQYDVTNYAERTLTFSTNFIGSTYFTSRDEFGVPNAIIMPETQGTYSVTITPAPGAAALLGLGGLIAARRRRA